MRDEEPAQGAGEAEVEQLLDLYVGDEEGGPPTIPGTTMGERRTVWTTSRPRKR